MNFSLHLQHKNLEDSDWDVLAIVDKPRLSLSDRSRLQYPVWDKGMDMGEEINVFSYTRKQWEQAPPSLFKHNVMSEGDGAAHCMTQVIGRSDSE